MIPLSIVQLNNHSAEPLKILSVHRVLMNHKITQPFYFRNSHWRPIYGPEFSRFHELFGKFDKIICDQ